MTVKALLLTNHLVDYSGSEIQILEIYNFLKSKDIEVHVFANIVGSPIINHFSQSDLFTSIDDISPQHYQLIWSQHALLSRLFKTLSDSFNLLVFSVHLSPFEMLEMSSLAYMSSIGAYFIANSPETADKLCTFGVKRELIHISYNCASIDFYALTIEQKPSLRKVAIISNHPPKELVEAAYLLKKNYHVEMIGGDNPHLVTPDLLKSFDCVISIGKTVQYSLLANKAVYCYDHFGGPGYLQDENYDTAQYNNFSGRGFHKKTAAEIVEEIVSNYDIGVNFVKKLNNKDIYRLDLFINQLLELPPRVLGVKEQQLIRMSYPIEEKIARFYQDNYRLKKVIIKNNKSYQKRIYVIVFLSVLLIILFIWIQ